MTRPTCDECGSFRDISVATVSSLGNSCNLCGDSKDQVVHRIRGGHVEIRICPRCFYIIKGRIG